MQPLRVWTSVRQRTWLDDLLKRDEEIADAKDAEEAKLKAEAEKMAAEASAKVEEEQVVQEQPASDQAGGSNWGVLSAGGDGAWNQEEVATDPGGYWDENEEWVYGHYADDGTTWVGGYWDDNGTWVPTVTPGEYGENGEWISGGYFDENDTWVYDETV